jgi:hypothetical protein
MTVEPPDVMALNAKNRGLILEPKALRARELIEEPWERNDLIGRTEASEVRPAAVEISGGPRRTERLDEPLNAVRSGRPESRTLRPGPALEVRRLDRGG